MSGNKDSSKTVGSLGRVSGCSTLLALQKESVECGSAPILKLVQDDFFYFHDYTPQGVSLNTASSPDACLMLSRTYVTGKTANAGSFGGSLLHGEMCVPLYAAFGDQDGDATATLALFLDGEYDATAGIERYPTINLSGEVESWSFFEHNMGCEKTGATNDSEGSIITGAQITGFSLTSNMASYVSVSFTFIGAEMEAITGSPVNAMDTFYKPSPTEFFTDENSTLTIIETDVGSEAWPEADLCDYIDFSLDVSRDIVVAPACRSNDEPLSGCNNVSGGKVTGTLSMYMACGTGVFYDMERYVDGVSTYNIKFESTDAAGNSLLFDIKRVVWTSITPTWEQNGSRTYEMAFEATLDDHVPDGQLMTLTHSVLPEKVPKFKAMTPLSISGGEDTYDVTVELDREFGPADTMEWLLDDNSISGQEPASSRYELKASIVLAEGLGQKIKVEFSNAYGNDVSNEITCDIVS